MARIDICKNFLVESKCDGWIRSRFKNDEFVGGWDELGATDQETADEICSYCHHFKMEKRPLFSEES
ncbi:MAG: hypothetical protein ABII06_11020 [Pseudomonadota bacterium]